MTQSSPPRWGKLISSSTANSVTLLVIRLIEHTNKQVERDRKKHN